MRPLRTLLPLLGLVALAGCNCGPNKDPNGLCMVPATSDAGCTYFVIPYCSGPVECTNTGGVVVTDAGTCAELVNHIVCI